MSSGAESASVSVKATSTIRISSYELEVAQQTGQRQDGAIRLPASYLEDPSLSYFITTKVLFSGETEAALEAGDLYERAEEEERKNNLDEAEQLFRRAHALSETGRDVIGQLKALNGLGCVLLARDELAQAEGVLRGALGAAEQVLGSAHGVTLALVASLARLCGATNRVAAEQLAARAQAGYERALGTRHETAIAAVHRLGDARMALGALADAEVQYARALQLSDETLGPEGALTLDVASSLGALHALQPGKLGDAEELLRRAMRGHRVHVGGDHASTLRDALRLASVCQQQQKEEKLAEAEALAERALAGLEKKHRANNTQVLPAYVRLALIYIEQGKLAQAEPLLQRALQGYETVLGPCGWASLEAAEHLGSFYLEQQRLDEAERLLQCALAGFESAHGPATRQIATTAKSLACVYQKQGKLVEAGDLFARSFHACQSAHGEDSLEAVRAMRNLARSYEEQGRPEEARNLMERCLAGCEKVLESSHSETQETQHMVLRLRDGPVSG